MLGACAKPAPALAPWSQTSGPPAAGFATLFVEPALVAGALTPTACPARAVVDAFVVSNPYDAPAVLDVEGVEIGLLPPRGTARVDAVAPGCYRVRLVPPGRGGASTTIEVR